jgi:hypothetical protein
VAAPEETSIRAAPAPKVETLQPRTLRAGTAGGSVGATAWSGAGAAVTLRTSRTQKGRTTRRAECSASGWSLRSGRLRISMPDVEKVGILPGL